MTPIVYALEIPLRAYQLLNDYWPQVTERRYHEFGGPLATTFLLSLATPMLNVPYERTHKPIASKNEKEACPFPSQGDHRGNAP